MDTATASPAGADELLAALFIFGLIYVGCLFAMSNVEFVGELPSPMRWRRPLGAGIVLGLSFWSTSLLILMVASDGRGGVFEFAPMIVALLIAIVGSVYAVTVMVVTRFRLTPALSGAAIGFTIALTHFAVMLGYQPNGPYAWNLDAIMLALALAVALSTLAFHIALRWPFSWSFGLGCTILALAVLAAQFIATNAIIPTQLPAT